MHYIVPLLYPNRCDNEAFISERIDLTAVNAYLARKNADDPEYKYNLFQIIVTAVLKILTLRPKMNRFIANKNVYQRNEISAAFVVKKLFSDDGAEALAFIHAKDSDTIDTVHAEIYRQVSARRGEGDTGDSSSDSMDMMQKKCLDFVNFVSNESKAYILSNLADSRIANEQIDEAESLLYVSARFKELPNTYIMLGKICYRKGYEDEAIRYWKKTTSMGNDRFAVKAYRLLSESENKHRRYKNALVLLAKADSIEHNLILSNNTETIANVEYGYEHSVLNKQKHAVVQLVKIVVLLLLISLIIYIVHIILLRKKILKKTEKLRESAAQISVCKKRISFLEKEDQTIANLLEQNKLEIAKIQESLQEAKRRTEEKCKMVEKLEQ